MPPLIRAVSIGLPTQGSYTLSAYQPKVRYCR
ncbi:uncharacterized protein VDAG_08667 [Verticillium dahliae VdLs.17]|uniref:Uncharacterized protein n=1 Tax=Verticillium dahliae (strain VdLs.17 / ATCC MYA-4575 / FGSC 10137) TaxID=498257 RepID=G2XET2_VERDV|nr:uncharacterized protein VDAG_08667 [Verticillium dahliae VdLs.17]EGY18333.1 hypothetical protein VDAG_08667 [Verticillium dahliae VdLs.17]